MSKLRLLAFGIDGLGPDLLAAALDAGIMPNLEQFSREWRATRTTWPPHTASGWTSLFSGTLPGVHGHFQFWDCQDPDMTLRVTSRSDAGVPMLWDVLSEAGWRVGLMNVPMTHPPDRDLSGFQFTWPLFNTLRYTWPPGLLGEIETAGGLILSDLATMSNGEPDYWRKAIAFVEGRTKATIALIKSHEVDALFVVHTELDRILHHCWSVSDRASPSYSENPGTDRAAVSAILQAIDASLGHIAEWLAEDAIVLIASDHGFGPVGHAFAIERALADADFLTFQSDGTINHAHTRAYLASPGSFGVNLNLAGRQSSGIVPQSRAANFLEELSQVLLSLRLPTGNPVFRAAISASSCYNGHEGAPDLLLVPDDDGLFLSRGPEPIDRPPIDGQHRMNGIAMLKGGVGLPATDRMPIEGIQSHVLASLGIDHRASKVSDGNDALLAAGLPIDAWQSKPPSMEPVLDPIDLRTLSRMATQSRLEASGSADDRLRAMGYL